MADGLYSYSVYGLQIHSNRTLPGLLQTVSAPGHTLTAVFQQGIPVEVSASARSMFEPVSNGQKELMPGPRIKCSSDQKYYSIEYDDGTDFLITGDGCRVWVNWPKQLILEEVLTYFLGPVLGYILRLQNIVCLHASGIVINGWGVLFMGPGGVGKSTVAAVLSLQGNKVLFDDVAPLYENYKDVVLFPGYPRVRLWPESVPLLFDKDTTLQQLCPGWDKWFLDLSGHNKSFARRSAPLKVIYTCLTSEEPIRPAVRPVPKVQGLMALLANGYPNAAYPLGRERRKREFQFLQQMNNRVVMRDISYRWGKEHLPLLCDTIIQDVHALISDNNGHSE